MRKVIKLQMELWKNISQNQFVLKSRDEIPKLLMGYNSTYTAPQKIVPCHASTDVSCLPFFLSAALRLQTRLSERIKYDATSRHLTQGRTLEKKDEFKIQVHHKSHVS